MTLLTLLANHVRTRPPVAGGGGGGAVSEPAARRRTVGEAVGALEARGLEVNLPANRTRADDEAMMEVLALLLALEACDD